VLKWAIKRFDRITGFLRGKIMTWEDLKELAEKAGVEDTDEIHFIDFSSSSQDVAVSRTEHGIAIS
jgi:hypothetical protein